MIPNNVPDNTPINEKVGVSSYSATQTDKNFIRLELLTKENAYKAETDVKIIRLELIQKSEDLQKQPKTYTRHGITYVRFNVHGEEGKDERSLPYRRVTIEIKELARALEVDKEIIKTAANNEDPRALDTLITKQLAKQFPNNPEEVEVPICKQRPWIKALVDLEDYNYIKDFYETNIKALSSLKEPTHIRKGGDLDLSGKETSHFPDQKDLPYSLIFMPDGHEKGLHVLLKTHKGVNAVGIGSANIATIALHMDSGKAMNFRDGLEETTSLAEQEVNEELSHHPRHCVASRPVHYIGGLTDRKFMEIGQPKDHLTHHKNVRKAGFIQNIMPTNLYDLLNNTLKAQKALGIKGADLTGILTDIQRLHFALDYAKLIQFLIYHGLVNLDQKPQNVLIDATRNLKLSDFGITVKEGTIIKCSGTRGYMAPEVIYQLDEDGKIVANLKINIWGLGCVLADIWGRDIVDLYFQRLYEKGIDIFLDERLIAAKNKYLPKWDVEGDFDELISDCLTVGMNYRPDIDQIVARLEAMIQNTKAAKSF